MVQMLIAKLNISDDAGKVAALTALVAAKRGSEGLETPPAKRVAYTPSPSPPSLPHTAAPSTAPSTAPTAPSPASTAPSAPIPINSSTHPAEYGKFRRWIESVFTRSVGPARRTYFLEPKAQTGSKGTLLICAPVEIRSGMFDPQLHFSVSF